MLSQITLSTVATVASCLINGAFTAPAQERQLGVSLNIASNGTLPQTPVQDKVSNIISGLKADASLGAAVFGDIFEAALTQVPVTQPKDIPGTFTSL